MKSQKLVAFASALVVTAFGAGTAAAQTGAELVGHPVRVSFADGTTNTVYFDPGGAARIVGADGSQMSAQWFAQNNMMCLQSATARECWPYQTPFMANQTVTLTSDCASTSQWTALSTNQPAAPEPQRAGERG